MDGAVASKSWDAFNFSCFIRHLSLV